MGEPVRKQDGAPTPGADTAFPFISAGELANNIQPIDWVIRGLIEADSLSVIYGDPASGKSLIALDMACSVSLALGYHGRDTPRGSVFCIVGEGQNGMGRRLRAWSIARGQDLTDAALFLSTRPALLDAELEAIGVSEAVDDLAEEHGTPRLIVIDTLAKNFGGDENSAMDIGQFVQLVEHYLRRRYRAAVLIVHHTGHRDKDRARGSIALRAAVDSEYRVSTGEDGAVTLTATKMKDAALPEPMAFAIRSVELPITDDRGEPVTSAVVDPLDHVPRPPPAKPKGKNQTLALKLLRELEESQSMVSTAEWTNAMTQAGITKQRAYEARQSLSEGGFVEMDGPLVRTR